MSKHITSLALSSLVLFALAGCDYPPNSFTQYQTNVTINHSSSNSPINGQMVQFHLLPGDATECNIDNTRSGNLLDQPLAAGNSVSVKSDICNENVKGCALDSRNSTHLSADSFTPPCNGSYSTVDW